MTCLLVKENLKLKESFILANRTSQVKMPAAIERYVRKQNIEFMHNKNQYSMEFFQFMRKLLTCNAPYVQPQPGHDKLVCYFTYFSRILGICLKKQKNKII